jgi:hypothetical protein
MLHDRLASRLRIALDYVERSEAELDQNASRRGIVVCQAEKRGAIANLYLRFAPQAALFLDSEGRGFSAVSPSALTQIKPELPSTVILGCWQGFWSCTRGAIPHRR